MVDGDLNRSIRWNSQVTAHQPPSLPVASCVGGWLKLGYHTGLMSIAANSGKSYQCILFDALLSLLASLSHLARCSPVVLWGSPLGATNLFVRANQFFVRHPWSPTYFEVRTQIGDGMWTFEQEQKLANIAVNVSRAQRGSVWFGLNLQAVIYQYVSSHSILFISLSFTLLWFNLIIFSLACPFWEHTGLLVALDLHSVRQHSRFLAHGVFLLKFKSFQLYFCTLGISDSNKTKPKQNKIKQNKIKQNKAKQDKTHQNQIKQQSAAGSNDSHQA